MSIAQVLTLCDALLQDAEQGLAITVDRLSETMGNGATVRSDFNFVPWTLPTETAPTTQSNIALRWIDWIADSLYAGQLRDAKCVMAIDFETFAANPRDIQAELAIVAVALRKVFDRIREYSDAMNATYGTIIDFDGEMAFTAGVFQGATSAGWTCRFSLNERSTTD